MAYRVITDYNGGYCIFSGLEVVESTPDIRETALKEYLIERNEKYSEFYKKDRQEIILELKRIICIIANNNLKPDFLINHFGIKEKSKLTNSAIQKLVGDVCEDAKQRKTQQMQSMEL